MEFDINRRTVFDSFATSYDKYRPSYPAAVATDVLSLCSLTNESVVLEVGSGTGKATVLFAEYGVQIDCVEPGSSLAEIAKRNCGEWPHVRIHVSDFERFNFDPKSYDLLLSASAFHWIDPTKRMRLSAKALRKGGVLALIYNFSPKPDNKAMIELSEILEKESDGRLNHFWDYEKDIVRWADEIKASGYFNDLVTKRYPWKRSFSVEEYIGLFCTFSDFLSLPEEQKNKLISIMREYIDSMGGMVEKTYESVSMLAECIAV